MNEERIILMLEQLQAGLSKVNAELSKTNAELSKTNERIRIEFSKTNERLDNIERDISDMKIDIKSVKDDTHYLRLASNEAFKDILMLDNRTESLRRAK